MLEIAKIKEVGFGVRDTNQVWLYFTVELESGSCSLQMLPAQEGIDLIKAQGLRDVKNLNGKMCWVRKDGMLVQYERMWGA